MLWDLMVFNLQIPSLQLFSFKAMSVCFKKKKVNKLDYQLMGSKQRYCGKHLNTQAWLVHTGSEL